MSKKTLASAVRNKIFKKQPVTKQELFNAILEHLMNQGYKARNILEGECSFLASDGSMCAIGCILPKNVLNEISKKSSRTSQCSYVWDYLNNRLDKDKMSFLFDECSMMNFHDRFMPNKGNQYDYSDLFFRVLENNVKYHNLDFRIDSRA
jgi:hypothetical protein